VSEVSVKLTQSWLEIPLGEVLEKLMDFRGRTPKKLGMDWGGEIPALSALNVRKGSIDLERTKHFGSEKLFETWMTQGATQKGDVLITSEAPLGNIAQIPDDRKFILSQRVILLRPFETLLDPRFLALQMSSPRFQGELAANDSGTTVRGIQQQKLIKILTIIPPLAEQKRIVSKIEELFSELDAGEDNLRQARRQLGVYRQSLLKQAFEGKLTATWRTQHPDLLESSEQLLNRIQSERQVRYEQQLGDWEASITEWEKGAGTSKRPSKPRRPAQASILEPSENVSLHKIPTGWIWMRFESAYYESVLGKMLDAAKNQGQQRPYLRNINVRWGRFDLSDLLLIRIEDSEIERYKAAPHDLIICEGGEPGRCAVWPENQKRQLFLQKALHRVRFTESVCPYFIEQLFSFLAITKTIERHFTGTTIKHLTGAGLSGVPVPLPSLPEQQEIVRLLDAQFEVIEQNEREIDAALKRSEALRQSILKKAFSGQLVPQDPADEPVSVLLERIRAERAAPSAIVRRSPRKRAL